MSWREQGTVVKQALLTGVSYMLPFVVAGGILIALGFAIGGIYVYDGTGFAADVFAWGKMAMNLMTAVLGGYIAYSMADKPALAPGFVAGTIAATQGSGFLGAILGGIAAGYIVMALKKIRLPFALRSMLPVLIIPVVGTLAVAVLMQYALGIPVTWLNTWMLDTLQSMSGGTLVLLGIIQGAMLAFDMGGPVNKAAYAFALAAADAGNWAPMAANFIASMAPPLGIALAILIARRKFTKAEQASVGGLLVGGAGMITEFAIPFAAASPLRVIPALMAGSSVGAALSYVAGLTLQAPHGGLFVLLLCNKPLLFLLILAVSGLVTAFTLIALRPNLPADPAPGAAPDDEPVSSSADALQLD
ncbi:PTS fructose transporter subunit IIC [Cellulomonas sp. C5510]|uniref:PTS fructose transporter subunit IIC n=1 Tax=Cellulomonas sp. C5510 TaxID=2871170 RepID=UPI001C9570F0|nr:PTS fructose transporter subunit IIC [Cellulomonas sp. C5510]QZN86436.1 PTS fructose transporter subunit IIC [Cellulomonas sp. C5510]